MAEQYNPMLLGSLPEDEGSPVNPLSLADAMRPYETGDPYMSGEAYSRQKEFDSMFGVNQTDRFNKFAENALGPRVGPGGGIIKQAGNPSDPLALAGLGGAAAFQGMFPFAGESPQTPMQNGTLIGVPDFNAPYIYPEAAQAFKGVEFNMPFNPLDSNPQISATIDEPVKNSEFSGTGGNSYSPFGGLGTSSTTDTGQLRLNNLIDNIKDQNQRIAQSSYSPFGGMSTASTALQNRSGFGGKVEEVAGEVLSNLSDEAIIGRLAAASGSVEPGPVEPESVEMVTPESVSNLPVNGIDVVAPISSIEAAQSQAAPGSPQAFFEDYRSQGPLTPEQIARGEVAAARMGTTFDPETGFSRDAYLAGQADSGPMGVDATRARLGGMTLNQYLNAPDGAVSGLRTDPQGRMIPAGAPGTSQTRADAYGDYEREAAAREGRLADRMQQPGESLTQRDTRNAADRTQSSQNVPTDVREAMSTPEGRRTAKQINRLARWSGSTQGKEMGGIAGLEQSLQPVDAQKQQYDAMRLYKLGLEIDKMQQEKPSEYQEAAAGVDEAIAAGSIKPEDRNKFILRDLGWQAKEGEDSSDLMSIIYGDSSKSGGENEFEVGQVREQDGKKYKFDGTNWNEL
jgi:hypothetical protein